MFKKSSAAIPEKQSSFTKEQIFHDIEAIRKSVRENDDTFKSNTAKREDWYEELQEFYSVSNSLVATLDDGGDLRDQLETVEKEIKRTTSKLRQQIENTK